MAMDLSNRETAARAYELGDCYRVFVYYLDEFITFVCVYEDSKYRQMALIGFDT